MYSTCRVLMEKCIFLLSEESHSGLDADDTETSPDAEE